MDTCTIYHNPRCSKSRKTLSLLEEKGMSPTVIRYLDTPPDAGTLLSICNAMGRPATALVRSKEARFRELGLSLTDERSDAEWCELLSTEPVLMERPIVVGRKGAALGRPPEDVLAIL